MKGWTLRCSLLKDLYILHVLRLIWIHVPEYLCWFFTYFQHASRQACMGTNRNTPKYLDTDTRRQVWAQIQIHPSTQIQKHWARIQIPQVLGYRNMWTQILMPPNTQIEIHAGTNTNTPKYSDRDTCGHKYKYPQVLRCRNMWAQVLIPPSTRIQKRAKYTHTHTK